MLEHPGAPGPAWWLPSLAYLAYRETDREDARAALDDFASRRDQFGYAVVEEQTDTVVGLSVQPWPLVDARGRLRFPISRDPAELELSDDALADVLLASRRRWHDLGVLQEELVSGHIRIGDTYAVLTDGDRLVDVALDVTWDAREAGKLAHYAAVAGVIPDDPDPANRAIAAETSARYATAYLLKRDPRDLT
jgi:hypothetical protein